MHGPSFFPTNLVSSGSLFLSLPAIRFQRLWVLPVTLWLPLSTTLLIARARGRSLHRLEASLTAMISPFRLRALPPLLSARRPSGLWSGPRLTEHIAI